MACTVARMMDWHGDGVLVVCHRQWEVPSSHAMLALGLCWNGVQVMLACFEKVVFVVMATFSDIGTKLCVKHFMGCKLIPIAYMYQDMVVLSKIHHVW